MGLSRHWPLRHLSSMFVFLSFSVLSFYYDNILALDFYIQDACALVVVYTCFYFYCTLCMITWLDNIIRMMIRESVRHRGLKMGHRGDECREQIVEWITRRNSSWQLTDVCCEIMEHFGLFAVNLRHNPPPRKGGHSAPVPVGGVAQW